MSFLDKLTSFCFAVDRQCLLASEQERSDQNTWALDRTLLNTLLHSLFPSVPSASFLGFKILCQMKAAVQSLLFSSLSLSSSQSSLLSSLTNHSSHHNTSSSSSSSSILSVIAQGNGHSITTFSSSYGLKGAVQVDYKWAALEELNSLWNSSLSLPSSSSPSLSSSFSMLSPLSHASAAPPGSIMSEEGPGEMEAIPWFLQDKKDEFVSLKDWHSFKKEQCDDIATIALHPYTLLIHPCGFGKSVYFEYFAYLH